MKKCSGFGSHPCSGIGCKPDMIAACRHESYLRDMEKTEGPRDTWPTIITSDGVFKAPMKGLKLLGVDQK